MAFAASPCHRVGAGLRRGDCHLSIRHASRVHNTRDAYYERNRFADIFVTARRAPITLLPEIEAIEGVIVVDARISGNAILDLPGRVSGAVGKILSLPDSGEPRLNVPILRSGRWPDRAGEVVVNEPFAKANGFWSGDQFKGNLNGTERLLTISGTALSPEFI